MPLTKDQLAQIDPKCHPKYCRHIFRAMTNNPSLLEKGDVYMSDDGQRYVGHFDDAMFTGVRLHDIICGGRIKITSIVGLSKKLTILSGFWDLYLLRGICATDLVHKHDYNSLGRFLVSDDNMHRTCKWCGYKQVLKSWVKKSKFSTWVEK